MGSHYQATKRTRDAALRRQEAFLAELAQGATTVEACERIGVSRGWYEKNRQRSPEFAARASAIIAGRRGPADAWNGTMADFERRYIPTPDGSESKLTFYTTQVHRTLEQTRDGEITLLLLPVGSRKTTTVENWCVGRLATDPDHRILVLSKSLTFARKTINRVKMLMTDPFMAPRLIADWGPFHEQGQERRGKPWQADYFSVAKRSMSDRNFSMQAYGWTGHIYGSRADTIVMDDVQDFDSLTQTGKIAEKFQGDVMTRRPQVGKGRIVIIGTRLGPGDFYEWLIDNDVCDHVISLPIVGSDGDPLDPDIFPAAVLPKVRKQMGEAQWAARMMLRPKLSENATFPEEDIDACKDPRVRVGPLPPGDHRPVVLGLDPNLGDGYTSIVPLAYSVDEAQILDSAERYALARTEDILDLVELYAERYRPVALRIEINYFQRGLARDDRLDKLARKFGFRVGEHTTDRKKNSQLLDSLSIATMARSLTMREIVIPWHDDGGCDLDGCSACQKASEDGLTRKRMDPLCGELAAWRPNVRGALLKQDRVMALWFAWNWWMLQRPHAGFDSSRWRTRGWPAATRYRPLGRST